MNTERFKSTADAALSALQTAVDDGSTTVQAATYNQ